MRKKIDWLNHGLEFIVVIIGILLAFQLNERSTENKQQKLLESHIIYLKKETTFNLQNLQQAKAKAELTLKNVDSLLQLIYSNGDLERINQLSFRLLDFGGVYFQQNAYNTMIQSGDVRFIKDFETKTGLINLYEYYSWVMSMENIAQESYSNDFYGYITQHFDLVKANAQDRSVYRAKRFTNALGSYRYWMNIRIKKYQDCIEVIENSPIAE